MTATSSTPRMRCAPTEAVAGDAQLERTLQDAITRNEMFVEYQPVFRLQTGDMIGVETLLRWRHPERGVLSPSAFIPLAETSGLIVPIGEFVLEDACRVLREWRSAAMRGLSVSVNVSAAQLAYGDFVRVVRECVDEYGVDVRRLQLEITETVPFKDRQLVLKRLIELRRLGLRIVLDDFGCGYMTLQHLTTLPVDGIKIDQCFTTALPDEPRAVAVVSSMVELATRLKLSIVIEGVETPRQASWLSAYDNVCVQGCLYARPQPILREPLRIRP
ncbi:EAL domain-containing protein [Achromobacter seleniivolatilans]|uniref:EAL domain-containing protein n=1 Tax=Achromobacter seleniivolatilans TaxID=3047478 RepID=A0ABY9LVX3_9BURK|nr:EAL domain-containing protein [Achromobacter sp. R39]WMD18513.1 EAL domain-containing protein [Achromobacter sp. R39]